MHINCTLCALCAPNLHLPHTFVRTENCLSWLLPWLMLAFHKLAPQMIQNSKFRKLCRRLEVYLHRFVCLLFVCRATCGYTHFGIPVECENLTSIICTPIDNSAICDIFRLKSTESLNQLSNHVCEQKTDVHRPS